MQRLERIVKRVDYRVKEANANRSIKEVMVYSDLPGKCACQDVAAC